MYPKRSRKSKDNETQSTNVGLQIGTIKPKGRSRLQSDETQSYTSDTVAHRPFLSIERRSTLPTKPEEAGLDSSTGGFRGPGRSDTTPLERIQGSSRDPWQNTAYRDSLDMPLRSLTAATASSSTKQRQLIDGNPGPSYPMVQAIKTYWSDDPDDLSFEKGQLIRITETVNNRWYRGTFEEEGGKVMYGIFPEDHVKEVGIRSQLSGSQPLASPSRQTPSSTSKHKLYCQQDCVLRKIAKINHDPAPRSPASISASALADINNSAIVQSLFANLRLYQTRLIKLKCGSTSDELKCDLLVVDRIDGPGCRIAHSSDVVKYEALSYCWLSDESTAKISVNGTKWAVPRELATALLYLRNEHQERYLWCDALCINQFDPHEKAEQIRSMLRIFRKATQVIAWLGTPDRCSGRLVQAFKIFSPDEQFNYKHTPICQEAREGLISALRSHLDNQWFSRTWVRQEVFAADKLILCMGGHELSFDRFNTRLPVLLELCNSETTSLWSRKIERPRTLEVLKREYQRFGTAQPGYIPRKPVRDFAEHWMWILSSGPLFGVSEERDRIYGALGILTSDANKFFARLPGKLDELVKAFPVSYDRNKTLGEVFGDVTKFLVNVTGTAGVLDCLRKSNSAKTHCEGLPSWAMDWRYFNGFVLPTITHKGGSYDRKGYTNQPQQVYGCNVPLSLFGVRISCGFDRIYKLGRPLYDPASNFLERNVAHISHELKDDDMLLSSVWVEYNTSTFVLHQTDFRLGDVPDLAKDIRSDYCIAITTNALPALPGTSYFLVSRNTQISDIIVSFYGSQYLHLIREHAEMESAYTYLGPLVYIGVDPREQFRIGPEAWGQGDQYGFVEFPESELKAEVFSIM